MTLYQVPSYGRNIHNFDYINEPVYSNQLISGLEFRFDYISEPVYSNQLKFGLVFKFDCR